MLRIAPPARILANGEAVVEDWQDFRGELRLFEIAEDDGWVVDVEDVLLVVEDWELNVGFEGEHWLFEIAEDGEWVVDVVVEGQSKRW